MRIISLNARLNDAYAIGIPTYGQKKLLASTLPLVVTSDSNPLKNIDGFQSQPITAGFDFFN